MFLCDRGREICVGKRKGKKESGRSGYVLESGAQELEKQKVKKRVKVDIGVGVSVWRRKNKRKKERKNVWMKKKN